MVFGTFSERSLPLQPATIRALPPARPGTSTRAWIAQVHEALRDLLPRSAARALLADDLSANGTPINVYAHFGLDPARLGSLRTNWHGLAHTAQAAGAGAEGHASADPWPGFEETWLSGFDGLPLAARVGWLGDMSPAKAAETAIADAIVIVPGLLGDNRVMRTRDLALGLKTLGYHVVALELRGHGQTDRRTPDEAYTFSSFETLDMLAVSRWLKSNPRVRRVGLIGFCWGANHALCCAWYDACAPDHPAIVPRLAAQLGPRPVAEHFDAGVLAFSPVLAFEELLDLLETPRSRIREPALAGLQKTVLARATRKGYPNPSGDLRLLIHRELQRSRLACPEVVSDAFDFVRMVAYKGRDDFRKLESARIPVLIVHAANDPLAPAQDMARFFARVSNPRVAGLMLPGGGHVGFAPYAREYYFNLIAAFFDARAGARAALP